MQSLPAKLVGPAGIPRIDETHLLAVASVHGRPQGEILQVIHSYVVSNDWMSAQWYQDVCFLLTRRRVRLELIHWLFVSLTVNIGMARRTLPDTVTSI